MAGKNGLAAVAEVHADPSGVFGRTGRSVPFGGADLAIRPIPNGAMKAQRLLMDQLSWNPLGGDTPGEQYYAGVLSMGGWEKFREWLSVWAGQEIPEETVDAATADETVAVINLIFEQSGIAWLGRSLGNQAMARRIAEGLAERPSTSPSMPENDSTSSTNSSSTSPALPPTPESMSPGTG